MKQLTANSKSVCLFAFTAFSIFALLYLGIFKDYGFTDAYEFLWSANKTSNFKHVFIQGGRPLFGELNQLIFGSLCATISDLKWIRLASLIGCVVLSTQIFRLLLQLNFKKIEAALFSFLVLAIPSIGVYVSWSATYEIPWALNCSFFAGVLLLQMKSKKLYIFKYVLALVFNIIALNLYQSGGTAFLIPLVFYTIVNQELKRSQLTRFLSFFAISFGLYFIIFKLSLHLYNIPALERSEIDFTSLPFHFFNFYLKELSNTFYGSAILLPSKFFFFIGLSLFIGFFILLFKKNKFNTNYILFLTFLILILPFSFTPNLLVANNFVCSRTIAVTAIIVLFYQFYFLRSLSSNNAIVKYLSYALAIAFIIGSSYNVNTYFTQISVKEYTSLKTAFTSMPLNTSKKIILIRPQEDFLQKKGIYNRKYADEYVQLSTERAWVPVPLFYQIMTEEYPENYAIFNVETVDSDAFLEETDSTLIIDLNVILKNNFLNKQN